MCGGPVPLTQTQPTPTYPQAHIPGDELITLHCTRNAHAATKQATNSRRFDACQMLPYRIYVTYFCICGFLYERQGQVTYFAISTAYSLPRVPRDSIIAPQTQCWSLTSPSQPASASEPEPPRNGEWAEGRSSRLSSISGSLSHPF